MPLVSHYHVLFYGSQEGYQNNRAQISLRSGANQTVAYVRFKDAGMPYNDDSENGGVIYMHLPSSMFQSVLDMLRNEKPINVYFTKGRGFLGTGSIESVGEGE